MKSNAGLGFSQKVLDVIAEISNYVIKKYGEAAWAQKMYSYEFYENTYALTKFALRYIKYGNLPKIIEDGDAPNIDQVEGCCRYCFLFFHIIATSCVCHQ